MHTTHNLQFPSNCFNPMQVLRASPNPIRFLSPCSIISSFSAYPTVRIQAVVHGSGVLLGGELSASGFCSNILKWPSVGVPKSSWCASQRSAVRKLSIGCMAMLQPYEVIVKAETGNSEKMGDCPFSQRVLLTLEEKGIPYKAKLVDTANKPEWFLEANPDGKVPLIKLDGKWVSDSDVITKLLEERHPESSLTTPAGKAAVGSKLFPSFVKFLKSTDASDGTEQALIGELTALNEHLKIHGPFINGENISAVDLSLAPKLYHLRVALANFKNWTLPEELTTLDSYIKELHSRESFEKTKASEDAVIKGWGKHLA